MQTASSSPTCMGTSLPWGHGLAHQHAKTAPNFPHANDEVYCWALSIGRPPTLVPGRLQCKAAIMAIVPGAVPLQCKAAIMAVVPKALCPWLSGDV